MKAIQAAPLFANLAPAIASAPPLLVIAAVGIGLLWLLSDEKKDEPILDEAKKLIPPTPKEVRPVKLLLASTLPKSPMRRIMRDDVAEALAYGARPIPRSDAVAALQALGFQKTAAYKALSPDGRFGELIEQSPDGLIEWKG